MREILDVVEIDQLNECFADIFHERNRSHPGAWNSRDYAAVDVSSVEVDFGRQRG